MKPKVPNIVDRVTDIELKLKQLGVDFDKSIADLKAQNITPDQIANILEAKFVDQSAALMERLSKHDLGMKEYIDNTVKDGIVAAVEKYDEIAGSKFLSKADQASPAFATGPSGEQIPIQSGAPAQGSGGFMDFVLKLAQNAVEKAINTGGDESTGWFAEEITSIKKEYDNRFRLEFRQFVRQKLGVDMLPAPVEPKNMGGAELAGS